MSLTTVISNLTFVSLTKYTTPFPTLEFLQYVSTAVGWQPFSWVSENKAMNQQIRQSGITLNSHSASTLYNQSSMLETGDPNQRSSCSRKVIMLI